MVLELSDHINKSKESMEIVKEEKSIQLTITSDKREQQQTKKTLEVKEEKGIERTATQKSLSAQSELKENAKAAIDKFAGDTIKVDEKRLSQAKLSSMVNSPP